MHEAIGNVENVTIVSVNKRIVLRGWKPSFTIPQRERQSEVSKWRSPTQSMCLDFSISVLQPTSHNLQSSVCRYD